MSLNDNIPRPKQPKLLLERSESTGDEQKLRASLAYRAQNAEHDGVVWSEELGTAEHRPRQGMIYDAPLGLKF